MKATHIFLRYSDAGLYDWMAVVLVRMLGFLFLCLWRTGSGGRALFGRRCSLSLFDHNSILNHNRQHRLGRNLGRWGELVQGFHGCINLFLGAIPMAEQRRQVMRQSIKLFLFCCGRIHQCFAIVTDGFFVAGNVLLDGCRCDFR